MSNDFWTLAAAISATFLTSSALIGLVVRFALVPYLREQIITPVQETHRTVTVNGGVSDTPTVLDRLGLIRSEVAELRAEVGEGRREHQWTQREVDLLWKHLNARKSS